MRKDKDIREWSSRIGALAYSDLERFQSVGVGDWPEWRVRVMEETAMALTYSCEGWVLRRIFSASKFS